MWAARDAWRWRVQGVCVSPFRPFYLLAFLPTCGQLQRVGNALTLLAAIAALSVAVSTCIFDFWPLHARPFPSQMPLFTFAVLPILQFFQLCHFLHLQRVGSDSTLLAPVPMLRPGAHTCTLMPGPCMAVHSLPGRPISLFALLPIFHFLQLRHSLQLQRAGSNSTLLAVVPMVTIGVGTCTLTFGSCMAVQSLP